MTTLISIAALLAVGGGDLLAPASAGTRLPRHIPIPFPDVKVDIGLNPPKSRGGGGRVKMTPDLQALVAQFSGSRGAAPYSSNQLAERFGIAVTVRDGTGVAPVTRNGGLSMPAIKLGNAGGVPAVSPDPVISCKREMQNCR